MAEILLAVMMTMTAHLHTDVTELSYKQLQTYIPTTEKTSFISQTATRKKKRTLYFNEEVNGWYTKSAEPFGIGYNLKKKEMLVGAPSSDYLYVSFDVPAKKGNIKRITTNDGKKIAYSKIITLQGTYQNEKNCLVVKNLQTKITYYFAQDKGLMAAVTN